jgi:predicted AAA+ superfamily ATPase
LKKRLSFFTVVAIQGARQVGKSFLVRQHFVPKHTKSRFFTFDDPQIRDWAQKSPRTFLEDNAASPLIIDEAQKAPEIFDVIKLLVDERKIPNRFLLLGSTEFSHLLKIRESLTGRMGRVRIFPMTLYESLNKGTKKIEISRKSLLTYLERGGMPGIFAVRDESQWNALYLDWVQLTTERDIFQTKVKGLDKDIALGCLRACARLPFPTVANIARDLGVDSRKIKKHLEVLQTVFVVQKIDSHPRSKKRGPIFLPFEVGLAKFLGANPERLLHIYLMNERLVFLNESYEKSFQFYFYMSHQGQMIHWAEESDVKQCFQINLTEKLNQQDVELAKSFAASEGFKATILCPAPNSIRLENVYVDSFESVAKLASVLA